MATRNFNANKSSLFAKTGSTELGGGQDNHLPVGGSWNGYTFRSAVRFATDWSGMKNIQSAVLYLKTSSAVHLAFSSDPDILIARATADWTANSASSSTEGGSGWSTAATNYPGPGVTTSGQVSKDVSTSEGTWISVDISTIVRAWAPASVVGGGGAANYGVVLYGAATGDLTEFNSYESSTPPYIVVTYTTDTAPVATVTGPSGTIATTTPTVTATGSDVDGDAIVQWWVKVYQGATVVHENNAAGSGPDLAYVTPALPGGPLAVTVACQAGGLWSAWTPQLAFTVDRPPVIGAFSAPVGSGSNRRPVMTWTYTDPDGNVATAYHLQVYATSGGVATGSPVYEYGPGGSFPSPISHTPTVDLPGGPLVVRAAVMSGPAGLWSGWTVDQPFTIALTSPSVAWIWPATDGGYLSQVNMSDLGQYLSAVAFKAQIEGRPPSGQTLTHLKVEWQYTGGGFFSLYDGAADPAGGIFTQWRPPDELGKAPYGSGRVRFTLTASGGGTTVAERAWKVAAIDWTGAVSLGDQVSGLTTHLTDVGGGEVMAWIRAQSSATVPVVGATWRALSDTAALVGELPSAGAWLGLRTRFNNLQPDAEICRNGSFEFTPALDGWRLSSSGGGNLYTQGDPIAPHGGIIAVLQGGATGGAWVTAVNDGAVGWQLVIGGAAYVFSAWHRAEGVFGASHAVKVHQYRAGDFGYLGQSATILRWGAGGPQSVWSRLTATLSVLPNCGAVAFEMALEGATPGNEYACFDWISLIGPAPDGNTTRAPGLDKWTVDWTSLG